MVAFDRQERVTYLNRRAAEIYDVDREKALGCQLSDLYRCEWFDPGAEQAAYTSLQERAYWHSENIHITRRGKRIHVESDVSALEDEQGRPSGLLATIRDVSAQKEAETDRDRLLEEVRQYTGRLEEMVAQRTAALKRSEARLRPIFEGAAIGIAPADVEGRIPESNPTLQAMLDYNAEVLCEMVFTDFTHLDDVAAHMEMFRELVAGLRAEYRLDKRYLHKEAGSSGPK